MSEVRRRYCIFGCDALVVNGVPLHRFPNPDKRPDSFAAWMAAVGSEVTECDRTKIYKNKRICDHHFDPKFMTTGGHLICSAIPTVNLNRVHQTIGTFVATDHSYCRPRRESGHGLAEPVLDITSLPGSLVQTEHLPGPSGSEPSSAVEHIKEFSGPSGTEQVDGLMSSETCHAPTLMTKFDAGKTFEHLQKKAEMQCARKARQTQNEVRRLRKKVKTYKLLIKQLVCRVCLALDVKMYNMKDYKLSEMFQDITGISAIDKNGSIQWVCWECTARLTAAAAFREKALLSDALLKDQVHIKESDIAILKQNYSSLKSPLSIKTAFTLNDIECEDTITENNDIDNIFIPNDETVIKERKSKIRVKEIEFEEYEPWIDVPVKTEMESDPIADNNTRFQDGKTNKFFELTANDTSPREDSEDEMANYEEEINYNDNILSEDTRNEVPVINDAYILFVQEDSNIEKKPKLDGIGNIMDGSWNEKDTKSSSEAVSVKSKKMMSSKVGIKKERTNIRNNENLKGKIIALKKRGLSVPAIAKETGASIKSIHGCLHRHNRNVKNAFESDSEQNIYHNEPGKEMGACSANVRRRLRNAGLEHILMIKPEKTVNLGQKISTHKALHDDLKQRIIALKQEGMSNNRVAYLLNTTRITVRKWWNRWCDEGHMNNLKSTGNKRKTTPQEDQLLIERVAQEQSVHTPSLAKELGVSTKCVRNRLREAGFQLKERKASIPLRSGRSHKVDEITKQQIISMKHNGVSVTDIANQFRVTRTSVYLWWRRWCKENNIKITNDNNPSTTTEQERSLAEDNKVANIVQMPTILSSKKTLWEKLPDVEFIS